MLSKAELMNFGEALFLSHRNRRHGFREGVVERWRELHCRGEEGVVKEEGSCREKEGVAEEIGVVERRRELQRKEGVAVRRRDLRKGERQL